MSLLPVRNGRSDSTGILYDTAAVPSRTSLHRIETPPRKTQRIWNISESWVVFRVSSEEGKSIPFLFGNFMIDSVKVIIWNGREVN